MWGPVMEADVAQVLIEPLFGGVHPMMLWLTGPWTLQLTMLQLTEPWTLQPTMLIRPAQTPYI